MSRYSVVAPLFLGTLALLAPRATADSLEDEFSITQDPALQVVSKLAVAPDDTIYVAWPDWAVFENTKINLVTSADLGRSWSAPAVAFEGKAYDQLDLLADDSGLHVLLVVFTETPSQERKKLYHAYSSDQGANFSNLRQVGKQNNVEAIRMFGSGSALYAYAMNYDAGAYTYFLYVSADGGQKWTEKPLLLGGAIANPAFATEGDVIHMVYGGNLATPGIRYARSTDAGSTWSASVPVSSGEGPHSQLPQIAIDDQALHVTWDDDRTSAFNVMYSRSTDGGSTWSTDATLNDTYYGARSRLVANEEGLHVAWCQYHGATGWPSSWGSNDFGILWSKVSHDSGLTWSGEIRLSQNEGIPSSQLPVLGANHVQLGEYRVGLCALWHDRRDGNFDLYFRNRLPLAVDTHEVSAQGGVVTFTIDLFPGQAGREYIIGGSLSGTQPGTPLPGLSTPLPINIDSFTLDLLGLIGTPLLKGFTGTLDSGGAAVAQLSPGPLPPVLVGVELYFAQALMNPWSFASNPTVIEIVP